MKAEIEKILQQHLGVEEPEGSMDGPPWDFEVGGIPEAAAAIAALVDDKIHEAEMEQGFMLTEDHMAEEAKLEARLAEITAAWNDMQINTDVLDSYGDDDPVRIGVLAGELRRFVDALAAAGKGGRVLWSGEAYLHNDGREVYLESEVESELYLPPDTGPHGQRVRVLVIEEPRDAEEQMAPE